MTYLCYIDEAGCATPVPAAQTDIQPVLVIVSLIVDAARVHDLTVDFLDLKRRYFPKKFDGSHHQLDHVLVEIKGSDLRSAIRKHGARADATLKFIDGTLDLLRVHAARLFATVWIKGINRPFDSRAIYTSSIQAACRNFSAFLDWHDATGFMVADSRTPALNTQVPGSSPASSWLGAAAKKYARLCLAVLRQLQVRSDMQSPERSKQAAQLLLNCVTCSPKR